MAGRSTLEVVAVRAMRECDVIRDSCVDSRVVRARGAGASARDGARTWM